MFPSESSLEILIVPFAISSLRIVRFVMCVDVIRIGVSIIPIIRPFESTVNCKTVN